MKCLDSTEGPDYVYTISVQGHGDYPDEPILEILRLQFPVRRLRKRIINGSITVNQIHEMDQFVKELTDSFGRLILRMWSLLCMGIIFRLWD